jgi:hypothetical protein
VRHGAFEDGEGVFLVQQLQAGVVTEDRSGPPGSAK